MILYYIFGRYNRLEKNRFSLLKILKEFLFPIIISFLLVFIIINLTNFNNGNLLITYELLKISFLALFLNLITKFFFDVAFNNFKKKNKYWVAILSMKQSKDLQYKIKKIGFKININYYDQNYLNSLKTEDLIGIIYERNILNDSIFNELNKLSIKKKFKIIDIDNFYDKILNLFSEGFIENRVSINYLNVNNNFQELFIKRCIDIIFSGMLLIIFSPIILFTTILIKIEDNKSIFYFQKRHKLNMDTFKIIKFRSMQINAEENGPKWSKKNDTRITNVGNFIRKYRIDELPQLISVLKGEMSLIGPRPERPEIDEKLLKLIQNYDLRYKYRPGITGWAQVNYSYGASIEDAKIKLGYDLYYIKNFSILLDLFILLKTIKVIFKENYSYPNNF